MSSMELSTAAGLTRLDDDGTVSVFFADGAPLARSARAAVTLVGGRRIRSTDYPSRRATRALDALRLRCWGLPDAPELMLELRAFDRGHFELTAEIANTTDRPLAIESIEPLAFTADGADDWLNPARGEVWMFRHGCQGPSDPVVFLPVRARNVPTYEDSYRYLSESAGLRRVRSESLVQLRERRSERTATLGFVTLLGQACFFEIAFRADRDESASVCAACELEGLELAAGESLRSERLAVTMAGGAQDQLEAYARTAAEAMKARVPASAPVGWSDWQYYRRNVTESDVLENVEALSSERVPVRYVLVDDGYQANMSDWLTPNARFAHGIAWLADRIRERGFVPGIWIAPFTAHESSRLAAEHPDWLLHDASGKPVVNRTHMGRVFTMDYSSLGALEWLAQLLRTLVEEYGYGWIKLDGPIRSYYRGGRFRDRRLTTVAHIRMALEAMRAACGQAILETEGYYGPAIGLADTQRVTQDIQTQWERLRHTAQTNLAGTFLDRRWFLNNPDAFILRDTPTPNMEDEHVLAEEELRLEITALGLTGGVVMLTDRMATLKPERLQLMNAFVPPVAGASRMVDVYNGGPCARVHHLHVACELGEWEVVGLFNWEADVERIGVRWAELGLPHAPHHVFEFWTQQYLGALQDGVALMVPGHGCRLISVRPVKRATQLVGTSVHLTMGAAEVRRFETDGRVLSIELATAVPAPATVTLTNAEGLPRTLRFGQDRPERHYRLRTEL